MRDYRAVSVLAAAAVLAAGAAALQPPGGLRHGAVERDGRLVLELQELRRLESPERFDLSLRRLLALASRDAGARSRLARDLISVSEELGRPAPVPPAVVPPRPDTAAGRVSRFRAVINALVEIGHTASDDLRSRIVDHLRSQRRRTLDRHLYDHLTWAIKQLQPEYILGEMY